MNELPHDPNLDVLPMELGFCLVLVAVACALLGLTSCAGVTLEPCVSVTNADGKEVKACVRIEKPEKAAADEEEKPDK